MLGTRKARFETLESKFCLSVTATVTDGGDLLVEGDADGPVEIVAVGAGTYQVSDNGTIVADASTLVGVSDDIIVRLESDIEDTNDSVTIDLAGQTVDIVFADLGGGDNTFELIGGTAGRMLYRGNDGADLVTIGETAILSGGMSAKLGDGDNALTIAGSVGGPLTVSARDGSDTVVIAATASLGDSAKINLGDGDNTTEIAGALDGNLRYGGGDGNDTVVLAESADVTGDFSARLGAGDNTVTHNGTVAGDFRVVSANADDVVAIADTAIIGGEEQLGLDEQQDSVFGCAGAWEFGDLMLRGRHLGFFFRRLQD